MLSLQRRMVSQWRMLSTLLFLGLICNGELMPVRVPEETTTTSSSTAKKNGIGSLNNYWQAWLPLGEQNAYQPDLNSATLMRRTQREPSVFIAPELNNMNFISPKASKKFLRDLLKKKFNNTQTSGLGKLIYFFN